MKAFRPEPQPDDAINVASPPGGWDSSPRAAAKQGGKGAKLIKQRAAAR